MSDFHETALLRYEEEQDQIARDEKFKEENPTFHFRITTWHRTNSSRLDKDSIWQDWALSIEDRDCLINKAIEEKLIFTCESFVD